MQELGFRYIYRFWNYMADINGMSDGLERYRQFNAGRKEAFEPLCPWREPKETPLIYSVSSTLARAPWKLIAPSWFCPSTSPQEPASGSSMFRF